MDEIEIVDYDPRWAFLFNEEAARLRAVLDPSLIVGLEHFGSTAIPGLAAKPIIDILIAVRSLAAARATFVETLQKLDYIYWADNPKKDRMFFVKGMPPYGERRTHHAHGQDIALREHPLQHQRECHSLHQRKCHGRRPAL